MPHEETGDLSSLNPTTRFDIRADDYARYRPTYPSAAIDLILADLGPPANITAADIGAGTGISTRLLADRGVRVIAIEPSAAMRSKAAPHPHVEWRDGAAEATSLPDRSIDLVVCAQAFHWFRPQEALAEFHRILRRCTQIGAPGRLALIWNIRDENDPLSAEYGRLINGVSTVDWSRHWADYATIMDDSKLFTRPRVTIVPHIQELDADGLIGRALSASYVPKSGPESESLQQALRQAHARFADTRGLVRLVYGTHVFVSDVL